MEKASLTPSVEKKSYLTGARFVLLLTVAVINILLLIGAFFLRQEGCVICLSSPQEESPTFQMKTTLFSESGKELLVKLKEASDADLISMLPSEEKVGFGYSKGDIAASLLYARGFDVEPVLKTFSAWPMPLFLVSYTFHESPQELPLFSGLTPPMRGALREYFTTTKAPYRLEYVLNKCLEHEDLVFAEEALQQRSDTRLWLGLYQTWHLSKEESWRALLSMKKEAIIKAPSEKMTVEDLCRLFDKKIPSFLAQALIDHHLKACLSLDDELVEKMCVSLADKPKVLARFSLHLLEVPRKEAIHQQAKKSLADLTGEPKLESMSVRELITWMNESKQKTSPAPPKEPVIAEAVKEVAPPAAVEKSKAPVKTEAKKVSLPAAPKTTVYVVQKGDTLWKIAQKFHVDPNKLAVLNHIKKGQVEVGTKLQIPSQ